MKIQTQFRIIALLTLAFSLQPLALPATPVLFPLQQITGAGLNAKFTVMADPTYNPQSDGTNLIGGFQQQFTCTNGSAVVNLVPCHYTLTVPGWSRTLTFNVPDTNITVNVITCITNGLQTYYPLQTGGNPNAVTNGASYPVTFSNTFTVAQSGGSKLVIDPAQGTISATDYEIAASDGVFNTVTSSVVNAGTVNIGGVNLANDGPDLDFGGGAGINGVANIYSGGSITASNFYGDGSHLTGIASGVSFAFSNLVTLGDSLTAYDTTPGLSWPIIAQSRGFNLLTNGAVSGMATYVIVGDQMDQSQRYFPRRTGKRTIYTIDAGKNDEYNMTNGQVVAPIVEAYLQQGFEKIWGMGGDVVCLTVPHTAQLNSGATAAFINSEPTTDAINAWLHTYATNTALHGGNFALADVAALYPVNVYTNANGTLNTNVSTDGIHPSAQAKTNWWNLAIYPAIKNLWSKPASVVNDGLNYYYQPVTNGILPKIVPRQMVFYPTWQDIYAGQDGNNIHVENVGSALHVITSAGDFFFWGDTLYAPKFSGGGNALTNLNPANIANSGNMTLPSYGARFGNLYVGPWGVYGNNGINSGSGDISLSAASGNVTVATNLTISGTATAQTIYSTNFIGNVVTNNGLQQSISGSGGLDIGSATPCYASFFGSRGQVGFLNNSYFGIFGDADTRGVNIGRNAQIYVGTSNVVITNALFSGSATITNNLTVFGIATIGTNFTFTGTGSSPKLALGHRASIEFANDYIGPDSLRLLYITGVNARTLMDSDDQTTTWSLNCGGLTAMKLANTAATIYGNLSTRSNLLADSATITNGITAGSVALTTGNSPSVGIKYVDANTLGIYGGGAPRANFGTTANIATDLNVAGSINGNAAGLTNLNMVIDSYGSPAVSLNYAATWSMSRVGNLSGSTAYLTTWGEVTARGFWLGGLSANTCATIPLTTNIVINVTSNGVAMPGYSLICTNGEFFTTNFPTPMFVPAGTVYSLQVINSATWANGLLVKIFGR